MYGLGLCIKVDSYVAHMLYAWSFCNNTEVPIAINRNKYFISLNKNTRYLLGRLDIPIKSNVAIILIHMKKLKETLKIESQNSSL